MGFSVAYKAMPYNFNTLIRTVFWIRVQASTLSPEPLMRTIVRASRVMQERTVSKLTGLASGLGFEGWGDHASQQSYSSVRLVRPAQYAYAAGAASFGAATADYVPPYECEENVQPGNPGPFHECPECHEHSCRWESRLSPVFLFLVWLAMLYFKFC